MGEYKFVNPYNFIPLQEKRSDAAKVSKEEETYTGVIEYSLLTKTALFVPNTSNSDFFGMDGDCEGGHKSYDFFSYHDLSGKKDKEAYYVPVIPGSEMRGMMRSNYEILTNSCMSVIDDKAVMSKRTQEKYMAGLLKKNGNKFDLYEAEDCLLRTEGANSLKVDINDTGWKTDSEHWGRQCYIQKDLEEGERVQFKCEVRPRGKKLISQVIKFSGSRTVKSGMREGYVIKGEAGPEIKKKNGQYDKQNKHCCHIFSKKKPSPILQNISDDVLLRVLKEYKKNGEHKYTEYAENYEKFKKGGKGGNEYFPVYYSVFKLGQEEYHMLAPACMTREIYNRKISDMIGSFKSCSDKANLEKLCCACALFGTFREENGEKKNVTSRIRVTDLIWNGDEEDQEMVKSCYLPKVTLAPLSSPKLNNMEFYLKRPKDALFWTYDYYIDSKGRIYKNTEGINGRKFYWHQAEAQTKSQKVSNQNVTIRPVKQGIKFLGKVYFQDISKKELNTLIYMLNTGDGETIEKKEHGYKLGFAKPLGYGSVAVSVDNVKIRKIVKDDEKRAIKMQENKYEGYSDNETLIEKNVIDSFHLMTNFKAVEGQNVDYPRVERQNTKKGKETEMGDIFDWFSENHSGYRYDKEKKANILSDMPSSRNNMVYRQYMEPMQIQLQETEFEKELGIESGRNYSSGKKNDQIEAVVRQSNKNSGVLLEKLGKIPMYSSIKQEDIPDGCHLEKNDRILVEFKEKCVRKDGKEACYYKMIKKI